MNEGSNYKIDRPIYSYEDLTKYYAEEKPKFNILKSIKSKAKIPKLSFKSIFERIFPLPFILLLFYKPKFLLNDFIAGFTMLIFHIPQGMAYGLLAGLKPINGLYTSFFPPLIYMLFGTSRHLSMGTFSIIAILASVPTIREAAFHQALPGNNTTEIPNLNMKNYEYSKMQVSITTTLLAGIFQFAMGLFKFGCLMNYVSDAMIGGFTTAASFHVLLSQMREILGYSVERYTGVGELPYKIFLFCSKIKEIHWISIGISFVSIAIIVLFNEVINPRFQKKFKFPLPIQFIVVVVATIISYFANITEIWSVEIVGLIPKGFPSIVVPDVLLVPNIVTDALIIAVVGFVINSALVKLYALKFKYDVNFDQESISYGLCNIVGSFFQCTISCGSLARTSLVVQVGMKSQIASLISCVFMIFVLLFIGPLFQYVPTSVLSAIIIVSLKSLIGQLSALPKLYRLSKFDFNVWIVSFLATMLLNVPLGLTIGILFSLLTIVIRLQNPKSEVLGQLPGTNIYKCVKIFRDAKELSGLKIFRFEAPLYFANAEQFKDKLFKKSKLNLKKLKQSSVNSDKEKNIKNEIVVENEEKYMGDQRVMKEDELNIEPVHNICQDNDEIKTIEQTDQSEIKETTELTAKLKIKETTEQSIQSEIKETTEQSVQSEIKETPEQSVQSEIKETPENTHQHEVVEITEDTVSIRLMDPNQETKGIILDFSSVNYIDNVAIRVLNNIYESLKESNIILYIASPNNNIRDMLENAKFAKKDLSRIMFVTVHDAVLNALQNI